MKASPQGSVRLAGPATQQHRGAACTVYKAHHSSDRVGSPGGCPSHGCGRERTPQTPPQDPAGSAPPSNAVHFLLTNAIPAAKPAGKQSVTIKQWNMRKPGLDKHPRSAAFQRPPGTLMTPVSWGKFNEEDSSSQRWKQATKDETEPTERHCTLL